MFITETTRDASGAWLLIRETRNWVDVVTHLLEGTYDRHDVDHDRCLIAPPRWTYWVGGHHRFSLGGLLWRLGQGIYRRLDQMPVVHRSALNDRDLVEQFGWDADLLTRD